MVVNGVSFGVMTPIHVRHAICRAAYDDMDDVTCKSDVTT